MTAQPLEELAPLARVLGMTGLSRSGVYRAIAAGTFPRPIAHGGRSLWVLSEVQDWIRRTIDQAPRVGSGMGRNSRAA